MQAYSLDLRERVVADRGAGLPTAEVARKYRVSPAWVRRLMQRYRASGQVAPKRRTQYQAPLLVPYLPQLVALIAAQPDATLAELRTALGVPVGLTTVWRAVRRLGLTVKKVLRTTEQDRPDVVAARQHWRAQAAQWDGHRLVFLDETALQTKLTRRYGRSRRSTRLVAKVPHGHWQTTTVIAALRAHHLTAPAVLDGPVDGPSFVAYIEQVLAPTLHPGDYGVLDNLACHKVTGVRRAIEAVGAHLLYLPPYSPDFNPIEQVFVKLKARLRAVVPRTVARLWAAVGPALAAFSPTECAHYVRHAGYRLATRE